MTVPTSTAPPRERHRHIPPNLFGIPFGLAGLGGAWRITSEAGHTPAATTTVLLATATLTWFAVLVVYLHQLRAARSTVMNDVTDPASAPFTSLIVITPMLLAAQLLYPHAATAGAVVVDVCLVLTVLLGGWLTGQWIYRPLAIDDIHPGYFLPTVAGGLLAATSAAAIGQHRLAVTMFGLGIICWFVLGSIIMNRLFTRPLPADPLLPTLAVEVAPPAVASLAWFALNGGRVDTVAELLGGYGALMALAQLRLLPAYLRLRFRVSTWVFTFSWAATVTTALVWLQVLHPAGYRAWQLIALAAISLLVGSVAVRTLIALVQRDLLIIPSTSQDLNQPSTQDALEEKPR